MKSLIPASPSRSTLGNQEGLQRSADPGYHQIREFNTRPLGQKLMGRKPRPGERHPRPGAEGRPHMRGLVGQLREQGPRMTGASAITGERSLY